MSILTSDIGFSEFMTTRNLLRQSTICQSFCFAGISDILGQYSTNIPAERKRCLQAVGGAAYALSTSIQNMRVTLMVVLNIRCQAIRSLPINTKTAARGLCAGSVSWFLQRRPAGLCCGRRRGKHARGPGRCKSMRRVRVKRRVSWPAPSRELWGFAHRAKLQRPI